MVKFVTGNTKYVSYTKKVGVEPRQVVKAYTKFSLTTYFKVGGFDVYMTYSDVERVIKSLGVNLQENGMFTLSAEAICNPSDTYNEEVGKKIARIKTLRMANKINKRFNEIVFNRLLTTINGTDKNKGLKTLAEQYHNKKEERYNLLLS